MHPLEFSGEPDRGRELENPPAQKLPADRSHGPRRGTQERVCSSPPPPRTQGGHPPHSPSRGVEAAL
jgi:hypothetical protein